MVGLGHIVHCAFWQLIAGEMVGTPLTLFEGGGVYILK